MIKRCLEDRDHKVISWGRNASNTKRYKCLDCNRTFTWKKPTVRYANRLPWFKKWLFGVSISQLQKSTGKSAATIRKAIHWFLENRPPPEPVPSECHLIINTIKINPSTFFTIYWDKDLKYIQSWRHASVKSADYIIQDLNDLNKAGVVCRSVTSNGDKEICEAVRHVYGDIWHQQLLSHLQERAFSILLKPKTPAEQELLRIINKLAKVNNHIHVNEWKSSFFDWRKKYVGDSVYTDSCQFGIFYVSDFIMNSFENMFSYISEKKIPAFDRVTGKLLQKLKRKYVTHRGLNQERAMAFCSWYLTIINKKLALRYKKSNDEI